MPIASKNFLLAFDFDLPAASGSQEGILFIHSSPADQSSVSLMRLMKLYPNKKFDLIKKEGRPFPEAKELKAHTYQEAHLPPDFQIPDWTSPAKFGLIFFCINMDIGLVLKKQKPDHKAEDVEYEVIEEKLKERYGNILEFLNNSNLKESTYVIDKNFRVWKLTYCDIEGWSTKWETGGESFFLPMTLLSPKERETLFELGHSGPAAGAIVNIGNFLGGSSILLGKGSKKENREKVYSFDPKRYLLKENYLEKNQVDDWVVFNRKSSEEGAQSWKTREDPRIRLLFIDGDHSYRACKKDISMWIPFLVPGGIIALHDYSRSDYGGNIYGVTQAVHDTILSADEFENFQRKDYIFLATRKNEN